uniref:Ig-like domain-containing protein n=1 Tax=Podarcis muralis TaxID=64176 RepID=A0A670K249_PODMU
MLSPLFFMTSVSSQPTLTQPPASSSVALGQTAKLSCTVSHGGSWHYFQWHQQKPGQAPRLVVGGTSTRGEGIPDRFTGSSSANPYYLTISNTQAEDEAVYYCLAWESNSKTFHIGST